MEIAADGCKGMKFILIRTSQASGLQGGERRSQFALIAYPLLMEAYRLNWKEATVTNMKQGGRESVDSRPETNASVWVLIHVHLLCV